SAAITTSATPIRFFFQAEDGIRAFHVTGVQTCALPIFSARPTRLTVHCRLPALRFHSDSQLMPGVTEASTAPLALKGCGSSGDKIGRASCRERARAVEEAGTGKKHT